MPGYCEVYAASEPGELPPLSWMPCADGTPGCRDLEIDWETPASPYLIYPGGLAGAATDSGPVLAIARRLGGELSGWYEMVMAWVDGPVLAAARARDPFTDEPCTVSQPAVGADRVVAAVIDWTLEYPDLVEHEIEVPLSGGVPTVFNTLSAETLHGNSGTLKSVGSEFMAMSYTPAAQVLIVPYDGSAPTVFAKFTLEDPWAPDYPVALGADVLFWADHEDRTREYVYHSLTGITETFIEVSGTDVGWVLTDGEKLVWLQISPPKALGGSPTQVELWSSSVATTPGGLAPQKEADLAPPLWNNEAYFESGLVVFRDLSWSRNIVLRLSDLVYWTVDAPDGMWWGKTLYATTDEVAMPMQPPYYQGKMTTIRRLTLAELGAPQPLTGPLGQ